MFLTYESDIELVGVAEEITAFSSRKWLGCSLMLLNCVLASNASSGKTTCCRMRNMPIKPNMAGILCIIFVYCIFVYLVHVVLVAGDIVLLDPTT